MRTHDRPSDDAYRVVCCRQFVELPVSTNMNMPTTNARVVPSQGHDMTMRINLEKRWIQTLPSRLCHIFNFFTVLRSFVYYHVCAASVAPAIGN